MAPDSTPVPVVRELLETRLDSLDASVQELGRELRRGQERMETSFGGRLDRIEAQVKATNGRVTSIELREAAAKAVAEDHQRLDALHEGRARQWIGIFPAAIAGACSGLVILAVTLLITGHI